jgi:hypothetical protein
VRRPVVHLSLAAAVVTAALGLHVEPGGAHKPITSPYTYNDDVFPVLRDRCGQCHVAGGVAPMSLMTHADTVPWGESIRTEILGGRMPPAGVDEAPGRFRNASGLTPREMNLLLTWVTGGTPIGSADKDPKPMTRERSWRLGSPDLALPLPNDFTIGADAREQTVEFIVPTGVTERRWVRAVDLMPGTAAMVRAATITVRSSVAASPGSTSEPVLALWLPGDETVSVDDGAAFELPPSSELVVRILYRKTWEYERKELSDRSTVGVYFTSAPATAVQALRLAPHSAAVATPNGLALRHTLTADARAIAIYPEAGLHHTSVRVVATRPDGTRTNLIAFHPKPDWSRRYWFREAISLPRGTSIDVTASIDDETPLLPLSVAPATSSRPDLSALRVTLNLVSDDRAR